MSSIIAVLSKCPKRSDRGITTIPRARQIRAWIRETIRTKGFENSRIVLLPRVYGWETSSLRKMSKKVHITDMENKTRIASATNHAKIMIALPVSQLRGSRCRIVLPGHFQGKHILWESLRRWWESVACVQEKKHHNQYDADTEWLSPPGEQKPPPVVGTVLDGRYRLVRELGSGGTSSVFEAEHLAMGNLWAVKVLPVGSQSLAQHLKEAEILKRLSHPMMPRIVDILPVGDSVCLVMDLVQGRPLSELLREEGPMPESRVIPWLLQLCDVLAYFHGQAPEPVIYRDLKPANLIADTHGHLKLVDFGTARRYQPQVDGDTAYIGTQGYAAPEQYGLHQSDARTDIYNLGMTLFHLLTATHPVSVPHGDLEIHLAKHKVSAPLAAIIRKCVQLSPANRYQHVTLLREEVLAKVLVPAGAEDVPAGSGSEPPAAAPVGGTASRRFAVNGFSLRKPKAFRARRPEPAGAGEEASRGDFLLTGQIRLAVMGACPGAGATFAAIALGSHLLLKRKATAIVEMNPSGDFVRFRHHLSRLGHTVAPMKGPGKTACSGAAEEAFRFGQLALYPACRRLTDIRGERPDALILDLGAARTEAAREELLRADWRLVYCPQADWKFEHVLSFLEDMDPESAGNGFVYLVPQGGRSGVDACRALLGNRRIAPFPHIANPFQLTPAETRQMDRVLRLTGLLQ